MFSRSLLVLALCGFVTSPVLAQPPFRPQALKGLTSSLEDTIREAMQSSNRPSMALIDREKARSMNYDNQIKHTKTFFEKRQLNQAFRAAERGPSPTSADRRRRAQSKVPDRLTVQQYDAFRGRINWPVVLRSSTYASHRQKLNELFAQHAASGGGIDTLQYSSIAESVVEMEATLKKSMSTTNTEQFMYARRFLLSLKYEARFTVGA